MASDQIPIGRFYLITRLSRKALRLYDDRGLLVPEVKDHCTGYRYYTGSQIARGASIKALCSLGFSLSEISVLLAAKAEHDTGVIRELFEKRRREIRSEVRRLQQIEAILESEDASLELIYMSLNEPLVKEIPPQRTGLKVTGPFMTLYYDSEYREKDATMECVASISGRVVLSDPEMEVRTLPGGKCLTLIHKGPYAKLHEAWSRIGAYAEEREFVFTGFHREVYLTDPNVVTEDELLTELQIPVDTEARRTDH